MYRCLAKDIPNLTFGMSYYSVFLKGMQLIKRNRIFGHCNQVTHRCIDALTKHSLPFPTQSMNNITFHILKWVRSWHGNIKILYCSFTFLMLIDFKPFIVRVQRLKMWLFSNVLITKCAHVQGGCKLLVAVRAHIGRVVLISLPQPMCM